MADRDPGGSEVLFPYLSGQDLNSAPSLDADRWVVDFGLRTEDEARLYPEPFSWVEERVHPHRKTLNNKPRLQQYWWRYEAVGSGWRAAIAGLERVIVLARVSNTLMPALVPSRQVFADKVLIFASDELADLALLSSVVHVVWAVKYSGTLRKDISYSPTDVFATLPRPPGTEGLRSAGRLLDEERRTIMRRRSLGLTKLYNLVNDPEIADASDPDVARLRAVHVELDEAAMDAYGWLDIALDHGFHTYRQTERWTVSPAARVEILDRLLEENHKRATAEGVSAGKQVGKPAPSVDDGQLGLFRR